MRYYVIALSLDFYTRTVVWINSAIDISKRTIVVRYSIRSLYVYIYMPDFYARAIFFFLTGCHFRYLRFGTGFNFIICSSRIVYRRFLKEKKKRKEHVEIT